MRDLLEDPHGRAIAAYAATTLLLPQNGRTIGPLAESFGLGEGERELLLRARRGEALLLGKGARGGARAGLARAGRADHHRRRRAAGRAAARRAAHAALRGHAAGARAEA